ncbi:hypothetical protein ACRARG_05595 [Pseudooceanicola sp. C21-150M6]|uniref:hypothetical protein n=1 Tax=Pseudooceanicola sp. C21-150M6 TaxID=3434355 RepID=UPI003D7F1D0B
MKRLTEEEQRARLNQLMPAMAIVMPLITFIILRAAGEDERTALIIAGVMVFMVLSMWLMRILFGPRGFIAGMAALALLGWRLQAAGIL